LKAAKEGKGDQFSISPSTKVSCRIEQNSSLKAVEVVITTSSSVPVKGAAIFAEGVFPEESLVV
jgi:hypothetical protein